MDPSGDPDLRVSPSCLISEERTCNLVTCVTCDVQERTMHYWKHLRLFAITTVSSKLHNKKTIINDIMQNAVLLSLKIKYLNYFLNTVCTLIVFHTMYHTTILILRWFERKWYIDRAGSSLIKTIYFKRKNLTKLFNLLHDIQIRNNKWRFY